LEDRKVKFLLRTVKKELVSCDGEKLGVHEDSTEVKDRLVRDSFVLVTPSGVPEESRTHVIDDLLLGYIKLWKEKKDLEKGNERLQGENKLMSEQLRDFGRGVAGL
jgi:hypothetical protein